VSKKSIQCHFTILAVAISTLSGNESELVPILRSSEERAYPPPLLTEAELPSYPWEIKGHPELRPIQKEDLHCQGRRDHTPKILSNGESHQDCDGPLEHGLPVTVQPILVTLLNWIQEKTGCEVVVTSGHRCPRHQTYLNASSKALSSKHQVGAEVNFYVKGWEDRAEEVIGLLFDYYNADPKRWDRETDVRTVPWYNDEVFVKLYQKDEGRDEDNSHGFAFIDIQVRGVQYTWKGSQEYYR